MINFNEMIQQDFANNAVSILQKDNNVIGLAAGGSYIDNNMDEYSDLDLVLITVDKIAPDKQSMIAKASSLGNFISGFTGEHVGEPRLLICLYDDPLLHVDIKFLTLEELKDRVEDPAILFDRNGDLAKMLASTKAQWPLLDYQWLEDRFWTWVHYACVKIGRGELLEAFDFLSFIRQTVLAPLMQVKNKKLPKGLRRVEQELSPADLENLKITIAQYNKASVCKALDNMISIYRGLRRKLYGEDVLLQPSEAQVMLYFKKIKNG